ncbi:VOC family protein [Priestia endophytica]|uniref:Catechol 2,3-dioxygenase n=1 Tax=Priestia endophytica DSM 13796 TaxID=1121089 RepID=A0A1I6BYY5_9BACI|nr:VOC family protein [Priestia endophytica]KYG29198.1 glyoxalase [Priestia endophytica]SFQ86158.1 Catechol 2,3-dioxygenase [Priestia endophytica DSM 13796]
MSNIIRGIDHIGVTVPDMEEATEFFRKAFDAKVVYDSKRPEEGAMGGEEIEKILGLKKGSEVVHMRLVSIGESISIELFKYQGINQRRPANPDDLGVQHFAVYVDNMEEAVKKFDQAGGYLFTKPTKILNEIEGNDETNQFVYASTPWGLVIELITYPHGIDYPNNSKAKRFTPPKRKNCNIEQTR